MMVDKDKTGEIISKIISTAVGAAFMTEDAVRNILEDLPLPKHIVSDLIQNAKTAKEDFLHSIRKEVRLLLEKADLQALLQEVLEKYHIEAKMTFNFKKKKEGKSKK